MVSQWKCAEQRGGAVKRQPSRNPVWERERKGGESAVRWKTLCTTEVGHSWQDMV